VKGSLTGLVSTVEEVAPRRLVAKAEPKKVKKIFERLLKDFEEDFYLDFIAPVDYVEEKQFEVNYNVWIYSLKTILTVKFRLPRKKPTIETISDLVPSAVNHEQEAYDLMGITFSGNSNLRRGFLVTEELTGFPLRKDEVEQA
jgi:NADH-quinone oxidoreductase subunit C